MRASHTRKKNRRRSLAHACTRYSQSQVHVNESIARAASVWSWYSLENDVIALSREFLEQSLLSHTLSTIATTAVDIFEAFSVMIFDTVEQIDASAEDKTET